MSNDPAAGPAHEFFDETRAWIAGDPVAPGSTITTTRLQSSPPHWSFLRRAETRMNIGACATGTSDPDGERVSVERSATQA